jgi:hypothetical protein
MAIWENKKVLITVRTYPTPAKSGIEVSCTAGVTDDGKWIRLFPVPYRFLDNDKRFRKYQWISVDVTKSGDPRPESYHLNRDSINIISEPISTEGNWHLRKQLVLPLVSPSLCYLQKEQHNNGYPTLGMFKPKQITKLLIETDEFEWTEAELAKLKQIPLFGNMPTKELEKIPYKFSYLFFCNDISCQGHQLSCVDWEIGQSFRAWSKKYNSSWEYYLRMRYEKDMMYRNDTYFYVGTTRSHPDTWIIVGLFYPKSAI